MSRRMSITKVIMFTLALAAMTVRGAPAQTPPPTELYPVGPVQLATNIVPIWGNMYGRQVDVDGDGRDDLVLWGIDAIKVALGQGNNQFGPWLASPISSTNCGGTNITLADFDGDGMLDLVIGGVTRCWTLEFELFFAPGLGNGFFGPPSTIPRFSAPQPEDANSLQINRMFAADVVPGGGDELIVCWGDAIPARVTVDVLTWASPGFSLVGSQQFAFQARGIDFVGMGDFNGDGLPDLLGMHDYPHVQTFFLLSGTGMEQPFSLGPFTTPGHPLDDIYLAGSQAIDRQIGIVDVNEDGLSDVVVSMQVGDPTSPLPPGFYLATGLGAPNSPLVTWLYTPLTHSCPRPWELWLGDFDDDGHVDAIAGGSAGGSNCYPAAGSPPLVADETFYRGDGTGVFRKAVSVSGTTLPGAAGPFMLADSDQDGDLDFWNVLPGYASLWSENLTLTGGGFASPGAVIPRTTLGYPTPGNGGFHLGAAGLPAFSSCVLGVSTSQVAPQPVAPGLLLDLDAAHLLLPGPLGAGSLTANAAGAASLPLPLPQDPALAGLVLYIQALTLPGSAQGYSVSSLRRLVIW